MKLRNKKTVSIRMMVKRLKAYKRLKKHGVDILNPSGGHWDYYDELPGDLNILCGDEE